MFHSRQRVSTRITFEDLERCDPPPNWNAEKQRAHERLWRVVRAESSESQRSMQDVPVWSAEQWKAYFSAQVS